MPAEKTDQRPVERSQSDEPAKGGTKPAHKTSYPTGDSPKPHGDKLQHAVDEAGAGKKPA
jgi:hypothetical protein